ncbi:MAG: hypothetical protein NT166_09105 [Candidatus Aminicenantes bacterium]|nr:hypothetical protein [Candidatus Aminicenantes bacterium]
MKILSSKKIVNIFIVFFVICILIFSIKILYLRNDEYNKDLSKQNENARREIERPTEYAIIGEILEEGKVYFIKKEMIDDLLTLMEVKPISAMPCGYNYYIKIYRKELPSLYFELNTECNYFTISDRNKSFDFGFDSNFFLLFGKFLKNIEGYIRNLNESKNYLYVIKSPISNKIKDLETALIQNEGFIVLKSDTKAEELNPYLRLNYVDRASKYPNLTDEEITSSYDFCKFKPDNIFNEIINHEYLKNKIALISEVYYIGSSFIETDRFFKREVKVYIKPDLSSAHFQYLKDIWLKNNQDRKDEYLKFEIEFIRDNSFLLEVISSQYIDRNELNRIVKKYNLMEIYHL